MLVIAKLNFFFTVMALPLTISNPLSYFESCVSFLQKHAWTYQHANISFLKNGVLEQMTNEEILYFCKIKTEDLNAFPIPNSKLKDNVPTTLQDFRQKLKELTPSAAYAEPQVIQSTELPALKKMNLKKQHEICRLANRINELCAGNEVLIDFGAGHGYLSEMLIKINPTFLILGLEAEKGRVEAARLRQTENIPGAKDAVVYKQILINEDSQTFIEQSVEELQGPRMRNLLSWSIIGLHACADLTVTSMRLFFAMPRVRRLIIMPCCYHKLKMSTEEEFLNFPLSESLRRAVAANRNSSEKVNIFNRPFLRLACQQTLARWCGSSEAEHLVHGLEMWQRAVAESISGGQETVIRRKRRNKFELELGESLKFESLTETYELHSKIDNSSLDWKLQHELEFNDIIKKYPEGAKLAEGLTCLQTTMQKLCENIVLYDRLCYMQECAAIKGVRIKACFEKLMNEKLSPRCYVLIAEKLN